METHSCSSCWRVRTRAVGHTRPHIMTTRARLGISEFVLVNQSEKRKEILFLSDLFFSSTSRGGDTLLAHGCQSGSLTRRICREAATTWRASTEAERNLTLVGR